MSGALQPNVGDLVAAFLESAGVELGFGVVSVHNIPLLDAINRRGRIRFVPGRSHDLDVQDARRRLRGDLGVLLWERRVQLCKLGVDCFDLLLGLGKVRPLLMEAFLIKNGARSREQDGRGYRPARPVTATPAGNFRQLDDGRFHRNRRRSRCRRFFRRNKNRNLLVEMGGTGKKLLLPPGFFKARLAGAATAGPWRS